MDDNNAQQEGQDNVQVPQTEDALKNFKAEVNRKQSNIEDKLAAINEQLQQLSLLGPQVQAPVDKPNTRPDPYLNPEEYDNYILTKAQQTTNAQMQAQSRQQAELGSLVSQYPELQSPDSELTQQALKIYNALPAADKTSPLAYKASIQSAALELGMLPKHKRQTQQQQNETNDIGSGNTTQSVARRQSTQNGKVKIDEATLAFAQAVGQNINDPEYIKRLEKTASRKTWGKYKSNKDY